MIKLLLLLLFMIIVIMIINNNNHTTTTNNNNTNATTTTNNYNNSFQCFTAAPNTQGLKFNLRTGTNSATLSLFNYLQIIKPLFDVTLF